MEENIKTKRMRKVSSWMTDAVEAINNEDEILAGKRIVLKIIRYMENNHMSQKDLAEKLDVSPQYINKFLHGQDCDIKVSTAIRYGKILGLKLIEVPDVTTKSMMLLSFSMRLIIIRIGYAMWENTHITMYLLNNSDIIIRL